MFILKLYYNGTNSEHGSNASNTTKKKQLLEEKAQKESDIGEVAEQNHKSKGKSRWLTRFPLFRQSAKPPNKTKTPTKWKNTWKDFHVVRQLETRISDVDSALYHKMENGTYGKSRKMRQRDRRGAIESEAGS